MSFDPDKPRYDQNTYMGRLQHFLGVIDPFTLFVSNEKIRESQSILQKFKDGSLPQGYDDEALWKAKGIVESSVHPETQEIIPAPFRMSCFVPSNIPICMGMTLYATSIPTTLFWQWINQSYNVAVNYANRSGSSMSNEEIGKAYGLATATSCGIAVGLGQFVKKGPPAVRRLGLIVPYIAVCSAGSANMFFMRRKEIEDGVVLRDGEGNDCGVSKKAGMQGVLQTIMSRAIFLPIFPMIIPPLIMKYASETKFLKSNPRMKLISEVAVFTAVLAGALPGAIALFPATSTVEAKDLEPEFHNLKDSKGNKIDSLYFNKGL